jgi:hypothetical protein
LGKNTKNLPQNQNDSNVQLIELFCIIMRIEKEERRRAWTKMIAKGSLQLNNNLENKTL